MPKGISQTAQTLEGLSLDVQFQGICEFRQKAGEPF